MSKYRLLHNIGYENHSNYTKPESLFPTGTDTLTFDGVYKNVLDYVDELRGKINKPIFFIMGDYVGKDNTFDLPNVPKLEKYCDWYELGYLVGMTGGKLGWHTWSHPDLTTLTREEIMKEITPPFPMKYFAYPYGRYNDLVIECLKQAGYEKAFSVDKTDGTEYTIPRQYLW